ncbi:Winged helix-turn-helix DNA-binding [Halovenus aranensis]|uniref:Winged helix-turn-helix DNA-binding n=2 Tax=Halovenus aranensis TaxID=890420 RepID=A0A1G8XVU2_9EURY|nr:Winged helix-turn-helix DNA-binding [Halovenus aranensis]
MRHKQVLDVAAENPDASMDELASMVPSATTELVERTLDEYGDPAAENDQATADETGADESSPADTPDERTTAETAVTGTAMTDGSTATASQSETSTETEAATTDAPESEATTTEESADGNGDDKPSRDDLSAKEIDVLRVIADKPTATQREIGDELGVSSATVNNRVNDIKGFEWSDRVAFTETVLETDVTEGDSDDQSASPTATALEPMLADVLTQLETLEDRIEAVEGCLETVEPCAAEATGADGGALTAVDEPELVHKALCACLESDRFSEAEELQLVREMVN